MDAGDAIAFVCIVLFIVLVIIVDHKLWRSSLIVTVGVDVGEVKVHDCALCEDRKLFRVGVEAGRNAVRTISVRCVCVVDRRENDLGFAGETGGGRIMFNDRRDRFFNYERDKMIGKNVSRETKGNG